MVASIITPTLNNRAKLARAIASVRGQTHSPVEHLIVDAMSTDGTEQLVADYQTAAGSRVISIREPDGGLYEALNKGIRAASGEIIGILNSDDAYHPDALAQVVSAFAATGADVVYGNVRCVERDDRGKDRTRDWVADATGLDSHMSIPHPGVFVRASTYRMHGGFDPTFKVAADYELLLRWRGKGVRMSHLDRALCDYETGGISQNRRWLAARETFVVHRRHIGTAHALAIYGRRALEYSVIRWGLNAARALSGRPGVA